MRPTPARVEVTRALIARVKAANSSINWRDELWWHRTPMPWTEIGTSDAVCACRQLAHGRWAGDRVGRSAREAGASLQMNETPQLQVAAARKAAVS
eukprot:scaffold16023_cov56-Phaeocystis_antarctica.AAC.1